MASNSSVDTSSPLSLALAASALQSVTDGIFLFDSGRRLVFANDQAEALQSTVTRLRMGCRCCDLFWQTEDTHSCVVDRALENSHKLEFEIASNVVGVPLFITVQPLRVEGASPCALLTARDISQLRRAEAEAISHKSFMANLADRSPDEIMHSTNSAVLPGSINERKLATR